MKKTWLLVVLAVLLAIPSVAAAVAEPGNPDMTWTNNGVYDGIEIHRAPVVAGKCQVNTGPFTIPPGGGSLNGAAVGFTDTQPLAGRSCYSACAFILVDFDDGLGPVKSQTSCSNADTTKPKGAGPFRTK